MRRHRPITDFEPVFAQLLALTSAALLDNYITLAIVSRILVTSETRQRAGLFEVIGSLSTKDKIYLGYTFGLYRESMFHDLTIVNNVRNMLVHSRCIGDFADVKIIDLCHSLLAPGCLFTEQPTDPLRKTARNRFMFSAMALIVGLQDLCRQD